MVHIGIIPDGNRRWSKKNNLYTNEILEHYKNLIINMINKLYNNKLEYIKYINELSLYVCSIDNLNRKDNTKYLIFDLIRFLNKIFNYPDNYFSNHISQNIKKLNSIIDINVIGDIEELPSDIIDILLNLKNNFNGNDYKINLAIAYDYNKDMINYGINNLENYNRNQSNIDLVLRSGGERRISGFFPTKIIYSELFFIDKLWPDVLLEDINQTIQDFYNRNRRFGK